MILGSKYNKRRHTHTDTGRCINTPIYRIRVSVCVFERPVPDVDGGASAVS